MNATSLMSDSATPGLPTNLLRCSVMEIACQIAKLDAKTKMPRFDPPARAISRASQRELESILDLAEVLRDVAFSIPAVTLDDAVAHLVLISQDVEYLEYHALPASECADLYNKIATTLAGVIPIVAAVARVDVAQLDGDWSAFAKSHEFACSDS